MSTNKLIGQSPGALSSAPRSKPSRPTIIGIYGISGCGKTTLLKELKKRIGEESFAFYDGSEVINNLHPGGLAAFKLSSIGRKTYWRQKAIENVRNVCQREGKVGIVTGHHIFWDSEKEIEPEKVWTNADKGTYTHILYLERPVEEIAQQRTKDELRSRPVCSVGHLTRWQKKEKIDLRRECLRAGVLFSVLPIRPMEGLMDHTEKLVRDFQQHSEEINWMRVQEEFDDIFPDYNNDLRTMLVFDGDKTLIEEDSGKLFWEACNRNPFEDGKDPLKTVFISQKEYTHTMFRQVMLLYEEFGDDTEFSNACSSVVSSLHIRTEFKSLLQAASKQNHVGVVVVTAGLSRIFTELLAQEGLGGSVKVIGSGRVDNGFVVTDMVKASLVNHIRDRLKAYVFAFGDGHLDISMLTRANEAIVVLDSERTRSRTMESKLLEHISEGWPSNSKLQQLLIPVRPLTEVKCPQLYLKPPFDHVLAQPLPRVDAHRIIDATEKNAAKLLMTPMRDASFQGPSLREAHRAVGKYLTLEYITELVGIEKYPIMHVQNNITDGYRLHGEEDAIIVALMRGGEPMALGVSEVLPSAMLLHAKNPDEVKEDHLHGSSTVILVDSVINNGNSMLAFVNRIRGFHRDIQIVMVAGVVQQDAITTSALAKVMAVDQKITLITLRLSENKYTGKGKIDTGNRLFNTTNL